MVWIRKSKNKGRWREKGRMILMYKVVGRWKDKEGRKVEKVVERWKSKRWRKIEEM